MLDGCCLTTIQTHLIYYNFRYLKAAQEWPSIYKKINNVSLLIFVDTTDVQKVSAVALDGQYSFIVECEFIPGTDAQGCLVILVGELDNVTVNLIRSSSNKVGTVEVANSPSSYFKVVAFDVEHDGSVATLSIPGDIIIIIIADGLKFNTGLYTYYSSKLTIANLMP